MYWAAQFYIGLLLSAFCLPAIAKTNGLVVNQDTECNFFMLKTTAGMSLLKTSGKTPPSSGTKIHSSTSISERDFAVLTSSDGAEYRVWVDMLDRSVSNVIQEYHKQCGH